MTERILAAAGPLPVAPPGNPSRRRAKHLLDAASLELDRREPQLLALGSQLAHGSVGLNAAELVYADHGVRTVKLPTILLSVMPHYASAHDLPVTAEWLTNALGDLAAAGALERLGLVTAGYFASPAQPGALADWYSALPTATRPPFILDPTLGDVELGYYTDPRVTAPLRAALLPLATGIVPNLFELAELSGVPLGQLESPAAVVAAARSLIGRHTEWVVVTGARFAGDPEQISEVLVHRDSASVHTRPDAHISAKGLGDTFTAALVTALLDGRAVEQAVSDASAEVRSRAAALQPSPAVP